MRARIPERWETDSAQDRALAVAALAVGLGPADEPFLERCLDDRAKGVREEAQRLLDRLPGSARAARMAARLRPLISVSGTLRKELDGRAARTTPTRRPCATGWSSRARDLPARPLAPADRRARRWRCGPRRGRRAWQGARMLAADDGAC